MSDELERGVLILVSETELIELTRKCMGDSGVVACGLTVTSRDYK
jgi:hypothetical protein